MSEYRLTRCATCGLVEWPHEPPDKFTALPCYFEFHQAEPTDAEVEAMALEGLAEHAVDESYMLDRLAEADGLEEAPE